jgi:hypothetical protein
MNSWSKRALTYAMVVMPLSATSFSPVIPLHAGHAAATSTIAARGATKIVTVAIGANSVAMRFPVGMTDSRAPSGQLAPSSMSFPGFHLSYVTDFSGNSLPVGWSAFSGSPSGDPGAQWGIDHVTVSGGLLQLTTYQDPKYGNRWVSGGMCQCDVPRKYGAYFVRSRMTGPGPTQVELLWPENGWPPEVDFNETYGGANSSMATVHFNQSNDQIHATVNVDMTQWHTWGVVWTPNSLTYVLDGKVWGRVTDASAIPTQPMTLHLQQQTWCASGWACPTTPQSTLVDWVAEYTPLAHQSMSVGPFTAGTSAMTSTLNSQIASVVRQIRADGNPAVSLVGYSDASSRNKKGNDLGKARVLSVATILRRQLASLNFAGVNINVRYVRASVGASPVNPPSATNYFGKVLVSLN